MDYLVGYTGDAMACWNSCEEEFGDSLVAIDFWDWGACYCQDACDCGVEPDWTGRLITRGNIY